MRRDAGQARMVTLRLPGKRCQRCLLRLAASCDAETSGSYRRLPGIVERVYEPCALGVSMHATLAGSPESGG